MTGHISFEDLSKFVWTRQITPESVALSLRVNQHLLQCEECAGQVRQLQDLYDQTQKLRQQRGRLALANRKMQQINQEILPQYGRLGADAADMGQTEQE